MSDTTSCIYHHLPLRSITCANADATHRLWLSLVLLSLLLPLWLNYIMLYSRINDKNSWTLLASPNKRNVCASSLRHWRELPCASWVCNRCSDERQLWSVLPVNTSPYFYWINAHYPFLAAWRNNYCIPLYAYRPDMEHIIDKHRSYSVIESSILFILKLSSLFLYTTLLLFYILLLLSLLKIMFLLIDSVP